MLSQPCLKRRRDSTSPPRASESQLLFNCEWCSYSTISAKGLETHTGWKHAKEKRQRKREMHAGKAAKLVGRGSAAPAHQAGELNTSPLGYDLVEHLACLKSGRPVLPRIPQGARLTVAKSFERALHEVTTTNSKPAWRRILEFAYRVLYVKDEDRCKSLSTAVKENTITLDEDLLLPSEPRQRRRCCLTDERRAKAAEKRLTTWGDVRGAIRLLASSELLASAEDEIAQTEMAQKHPPAHCEDTIEPQPDVPPPRACSVLEVLNALKSFPKGSAGGLDGLTAQHLNDILSVEIDTRTRVLEKLALVCDLFAQGKVPEQVKDAVFGAWLVAARKPGGDLRPIAVGSVLRRLASKVVLARARRAVVGYLQPRQLGFGTKGGTEACVHAVRTYMEGRDRCALLKLDFANAFNSHRRAHMLKEVRRMAPEVFYLAYQAYQASTPIVFGKKIIASQAGCQQGDVTSPLLFSLLLHTTLLKLNSELPIAYLDDLVLCDTDHSKLLADIGTIANDSGIHGLIIKPQKCELFLKGYTSSERAAIIQDIQEVLPGCRVLEPDGSDFELLGAPMFPGSVKAVFTKKLEAHELLLRRTGLLSAHVATYLLQHAAGVQKVVYALRAGPVYAAPEVCSAIDRLVAQCLERVLDRSLSADVLLQIGLPCAMGGLGVTHSSQLALPAFLAACHANKALVERILPPESLVLAGYQHAMERWTAEQDSVPDENTISIQREWAKISYSKAQSSLLNKLGQDEEARLRLSCAFHPTSGYWLGAFPSANVGTLMSDQDFRAACSLRLGLPLVHAHECCCGSWVGETAVHKLSCMRGASARESRHNAVNDVLSRALSQAGIPNTKEPRRLSEADDLRPDGLTLLPWSRGAYAVWDVSIRDSFAASYRGLARCVGAIAAKAEEEKRKKYEFLGNGYEIIPVVVESTGVWGKSALEFTKLIGKRIRLKTGEERATTFIRQRMSIEVQRGNAQMAYANLLSDASLHELDML